MNDKYGCDASQERSRASVLGMPVISISEGAFLGEVKQILLDGNTYHVQGFLIEKKHSGREDRILPFSAVSSFGKDSITVENQSVLERKGASHQYIRALRQPLSVLGARVFTAGGNTLGKVEEYRFSILDGSITGIEINGGLFKKKKLTSGRHIIAISPQTVMLKEAAIEDAVDADEVAPVLEEIATVDESREDITDEGAVAKDHDAPEPTQESIPAAPEAAALEDAVEPESAKEPPAPEPVFVEEPLAPEEPSTGERPDATVDDTRVYLNYD